MPEVINIIGRGVTDPHIHAYDGRAYLFGTHDYSPANTKFDMRDWQVWSSSDLLNWRLESTLRPEGTYIGQPSSGCWATDAVEKDGKYYWAFSDMNRSGAGPQLGMVVGEAPGGPWADVLKQPLLTPDCADTAVYDPCWFKDDDGSVYLVFGVWTYYMVRMSDDMVSVAEAPRPLTVLNPRGPYGEGKTDDKASLHKHNGLYYLSWGSYYATSESLRGPYTYRGCVVDPVLMEARFRETTWPHGPTQGRHGNYFLWKGQWYFTYCEMAFSGNRYFRDFWISKVNYGADGRILPIRIDSTSML